MEMAGIYSVNVDYYQQKVTVWAGDMQQIRCISYRKEQKKGSSLLESPRQRSNGRR
jgi:hypothetical protein